ncbi:hypothetical protein R1T16_02720 [Flavobacterium sp. DG1-102-2]|uniref:hypothetical protein n=1 Tax=Flavobacterium sp. DG1-102-2 TaxID=3081663 RepID=UPI00294984D8|nr:hypothetical protein [Flavobacterium sp. DG1-102-2]MDV6167320.1 hypothetical protein [Flavobacterium sp. DG1-102-2]
MMFRFFLTLYIFLLSGYGNLHAHTQANMCPESVKNLEATEHISLVTLIDDNTHIVNCTPTIKENNKVVISDNEIEDDETSSSKKSLEINKCFTLLSFSHSARDIISYTNNGIPAINKNISYFTSHRWYIIFRVIRL